MLHAGNYTRNIYFLSVAERKLSVHFNKQHQNFIELDKNILPTRLWGWLGGQEAAERLCSAQHNRSTAPHLPFCDPKSVQNDQSGTGRYFNY